MQVQQHAQKLTQHQSFWAKVSEKLKHPLAHKRTQEEVYESTQTPFNSPEKTTRASVGSGPTQGAAVAESEVERKTIEASPVIEERSPSPPRTTEAGIIEAVVPQGAASEAASTTTAAAPTQAASSIAAKAPKETPLQPVIASLETVDNQRKCVLAKYLFIHHCKQYTSSGDAQSCEIEAMLTRFSLSFTRVRVPRDACVCRVQLQDDDSHQPTQETVPRWKQTVGAHAASRESQI